MARDDVILELNRIVNEQRGVRPHYALWLRDLAVECIKLIEEKRQPTMFSEPHLPQPPEGTPTKPTDDEIAKVAYWCDCIALDLYDLHAGRAKIVKKS